MSAHKDFGKSLAVRGTHVIFCEDPIIKHLTPEQLAALHMCKSEIMASIFRLYMTVPQSIADKLLKEYIKIP